MNSEIVTALATMLLLGAFHGVNPAMGWLFSVALGLQEKSRRAVLTSLLPLAAGHLVSVGVVLAIMTLVGRLLPHSILRYGTAAVLVIFAAFLFVRHRHPRFGGMRMSWRDLTIWSFLVATAHGAGLMVVPFLFGTSLGTGPPTDGGVPGHATHFAVDASAADVVALPLEPVVGLAAVLFHTIGYLLVLGLIAIIVYEKLGLRLLRTHWVNLDVVWIGALLLTALLTLIL